MNNDELPGWVCTSLADHVTAQDIDQVLRDQENSEVIRPTDYASIPDPIRVENLGGLF